MTPSDKRLNRGRRVRSLEETNEIPVSPLHCWRHCASRSFSIANRWSPGNNAMNTVHSDDVAGGLWAAAEWMSGVGRAEALNVAGEEIYWRNDKNKVREVAGMPPPEGKIFAPLFNLVGIISCRLSRRKTDFDRRTITGPRLTRLERL